MAKAIILPRQGNTVESCLLLEWKKKEGDRVAAGEVVCDVETDKATFEIESPDAGTLLRIFFPAGSDVPVMTVIAALGEPGENVDDLAPAISATESSKTPPSTDAPVAALLTEPRTAIASSSGISPRARNLANAKGINRQSVSGSGPGGRILERDIRKALGPGITRAAADLARQTGMDIPSSGSGPGGLIRVADLQPPHDDDRQKTDDVAGLMGPFNDIPVKGVRKRIAMRMQESLATTAQLTLSTAADATAILRRRKQYKQADAPQAFQSITLNDFILYAVARTLPLFRYMNAHFLGNVIREFDDVHLGFAVDTPKGLIVPVIRRAQSLTLSELSTETKRLSRACQEGSIVPDEMNGGTFTVTNLGMLGIENFTPVLNPPEVGILGVGATILRPIARNDSVSFAPHILLSLTHNHQSVDGAPAARFLQAVSSTIAGFDQLLETGISQVPLKKGNSSL